MAYKAYFNMSQFKFSSCRWPNANDFWAILRLCMAWIFIWSFFDKLLGLGFTTAKEAAWVSGGSPTFGFLQFATKGPFQSVFQSIAGSAILDWVFMIGMLAIGVAFALGIGMRVAAGAGVALFVLIYVAGFMPPEHNPFLDEHLIYAILLVALAVAGAGRYWGLGNRWGKQKIVKRFSFLI